ncbi:Amidohydrolase [Enhygromyxa salina]|uniref:Amidohydrolase n=1 Tax=Enhygromyxa salina TaxID=215803 RepID=A0A2S9XC53_9BACT|nr:amidohydrolase family protein [Enhygromyxa salina]PRP90435.1 Amidohydrolase [Enhygromyxa salina]
MGSPDQAAGRLSLWVAVALSIACLSCGPEPLGVVVEGERIPVIDMHLHTGDWDKIPSQTQAFIAGNLPFPFNLNPEAAGEQVLDPEGLVEELDGAGISHGVIYSVYAPITVGIAPNEETIAKVAAHSERLWGFASLRVDRWGSEQDMELDKLREALEAPGMIGVKLAHAHMHFRMDDPLYYGIYELAAELDKPVYLHTGTSPFPGTSQAQPYTDPRYLEQAIEAFPDTIFILGHLGFDFIGLEHAGLDDCVRLAETYENVYLEASALGSDSSDPEGDKLAAAHRAIREAGVVDRLIYGSDGPQRPGFVAEYLERTLVAMDAAGYTLDEQRAVLAGNFARVFDLPEPEL